MSFTPATGDRLFPILGYGSMCVDTQQLVSTNSAVTPIPDKDVTGATSNISVAGARSTASNRIYVTVDISHQFIGDLTLKLKSPQGTEITLWSSLGNSGQVIQGTFPTTLLPTESMSVFDGENFNGVWSLTAIDSALGDTGNINSWSIAVENFEQVAGASNTPTFSNLVNGQHYNCTSKASSALGEGSVSGPASVHVGTPIAPTLSSVEARENAVRMTFSANASNGSPITGFTASCGAPSVQGVDSPLTVGGLNNGVEYLCNVTAQNAIGSSLPSNAMNATPQTAVLPVPPTITSVEPNDGSLTVRFTPGYDGGGTVSSYTVTCGTKSVTGAGPPIKVLGLENGNSYSCSVVATNSAGPSPPSTPFIGTPAPQDNAGLPIWLIWAATQPK